MSKMGELYTEKQGNERGIRANPAKAKAKKTESAPKNSTSKPTKSGYIRTYYKAVKKMTDEVGKFFMHYKLAQDLDELSPSPDSIRVFMDKHEGSRDVLHSKISEARVECKLAFENVRFWTKQLGKPLTQNDSDGRILLSMLCVIGQNGVWDMETARLRRERFRTIAKRQLAKSDENIEFLSPYDLEEEFTTYLQNRKRRLAKKAEPR